MKPVAANVTASTLATAELLRRIDDMPMSARERARAKAMLLRAEYIADWFASLVTKLKSPGARIVLRSTRRSVLRNSPAHR